jgi:hypothetical protein
MVEDPFISDSEDLMGIDLLNLESGKPVENWNSNAWIRCADEEWEGVPDDVLHNSVVLPIYSARLQKIMQDAGFLGIQFLPIRVLYKRDQEIPGFAIANILNVPSAMDMQRSEYERFGDDDPERREQVSGVDKMVLKRTALDGYDIVRVREYDVPLYASERFKHAFEEANCTGYSFKEVELS